MRVLHVVETLQGGLATYLNQLLPGQVSSEDISTVTLLAPYSDIGALDAETLNGVETRLYARKNRAPLSLFRLLVSYLRTLRECQPDVVHVHSSYAGVVCRLWPGRAPVVYCPHGWAFDRVGSAILNSVFAFIERVLARRCAAVVAISGYECRAAFRVGIPKNKVHLIRLGIADNAKVAVQDEHTDKAPLRLLFVGRFDKQKGLDWLLTAIAGIEPGIVELTVVGDWVTDAPQDWHWPEQVRRRGRLAAHDVDQEIGRADAVIVPSRWEGFGLVTLEAMRQSVPVLASDRGALPEVVGDGEGGIVFTFGDTSALRSLLRSLTREKLRCLGSRARQRFLNEFSKDAMISQTQALYRYAMQSNTGRVEENDTSYG